MSAPDSASSAPPGAATTPQPAPGRGYRRLGGWWWVALPLVPLVLLGLTLLVARGGIESDLRARTEQALTDAGVSGAHVEFRGRDAHVTASSGNAAAIEAIVTGVSGVRAATVDTSGLASTAETTVNPTASPDDGDHDHEGEEDDHSDHMHGEDGEDVGEFTVVNNGGTLTLRARVPSQTDKDALLAVARQAAAGREVTDEITIREGTTPVVNEAAAAVVRALSLDGAQGAKAIVRNGDVMLHGTVANTSVKARLEAEAAYPGVNVDNHMTAPDDVPTTAEDCEHANEDVEMLLKAQEVRFITGSATVSQGSLDELQVITDLLAPCLEITNNTTVTVSGHTDNVGDPAVNLRLSQQRADAVRDILVADGLAADTVQSRGFGDAEPTADNNTAEGRAANRRVEIVME